MATVDHRRHCVMTRDLQQGLLISLVHATHEFEDVTMMSLQNQAQSPKYEDVGGTLTILAFYGGEVRR
jgi:hypothetical protein